MFRATVLLAVLAAACAFTAPKSSGASSALMAKSKSLPFLEQPTALDGKRAGDVGFDPLGLSSIFPEKDWSTQVVPNFWPDAARTPLSTADWMVEAEIKHGRFAMLAVLGWVAVDLGVRFPGSGYESIPNSLAAHNAAASNGSLAVLLFIISFFELINGAAIYDASKGSGRKPGEFGFDPLGFSKDPKARERYATNEIKNGRLAMLAFSGIVTQAALFPDQAFPYF